MAKHLSALNHSPTNLCSSLYVCMSIIHWTAHIGTYTIHMYTSLIAMMASSAGAVSLLEGCVAGQQDNCQLVTVTNSHDQANSTSPHNLNFPPQLL